MNNAATRTVVVSNKVKKLRLMSGCFQHATLIIIARSCNPYHFGGVEFRVNKRDMGHIHGEKLADLPFPIEIRKDLIASGKALPHIIYPESRWISYSEEDTPLSFDCNMSG